MNETITKKMGSKTIDLSAVTSAGFNNNEVCIGYCPNCQRLHTVHIFSNEKEKEYILACTHCGFRARGAHGATYFNQWADREIRRLDRRIGQTKAALTKKSITARKNAVKSLYC